MSNSTSNLGDWVSRELLPHVSQPAQYIGHEVNQLVSAGDWQGAGVRVAIAFPDTYTIGMSHLGCQILYWLCNHTPGVCAERVYCPGLDAEAILRAKCRPLFTWDTRQPVGDADILAVSLQYEMTFTNVLTILDLAGIPLRSCRRDDSHPLVIAGGPQADNPEPMAPFLDLVVLGDGEEAMRCILEEYQALREAGVRRREMILHMARKFPWIYAPQYYEASYDGDGRVTSMTPTHEGIPTEIERCRTADLNKVPVPTRPLVPHVQVVHDRISVEIMRGCPQRCRFCHAGYTKRPLKLRSVDKILEIIEQAYWATGHDEIGLLSLSTADYPYLRELAERANARFAPRHVGLSLPSLRVDKMLEDIPWMVSQVRKSGLTIAVEAAKDDLRAAIRKKVTDDDLMDGVRQAYRAGWKSVKLYFMAGFPGEQPEDIDGIYDLAREVSLARKEIAGSPAAVTVSVGWLVPKPHTPLQWAAQPTKEYFQFVRERLFDRARRRRGAVRFKMHDIDRSILEAVFARGDRRLADTIEHAWRSGARFDGWDEHFNLRFWNDAFEATGINPTWHAHRERSYDEVLPWDHIRSGPKRTYLQQQYDDLLLRVAAPNRKAAKLL